MNLKEEILACANTSARNFVKYDRKNDEDMPEGIIDLAIVEDEVTIDEIVEEFKKQTIDWLSHAITEHYETRRKKYVDDPIPGSESFIAYYRDKYPEYYNILKSNE